MRSALSSVATAAAVLVLAGPLSAQAAGAVAESRANLTRVQLEAMLTASLEAALSASAEPLRDQARAEATLIRTRLDAGDVRAGDLVVLTVQGQAQLSDTFTVSEARTLPLPGVGEVSLDGALRSELAGRIAAHLATFIADPAVEARALIPLEIGGAVARPGVYALPAETPVADVLAVAGGATRADSEDATRIRRAGDVVWEGHALRAASLMGLSLDQLSLAAGDRIEVPGERSEGNAFLRNGLVAAGAALSFLAVLAQVLPF